MYLAAALALIGGTSYVIDTVQGRTQPNRISWLLWAIAPLLAFFGALDEGVGLQSLMSFMVGFVPACVFAASFVNRKAYWRITSLDIGCGVLSVCGLIAWLATQEGNAAIVAAIAADGIAGVPTFAKAYRNPRSESSLIFWLGAANAGITLLTIDHWRFANFGFPVYILLGALSLALVITFRIGERPTLPAVS